MRFTSYFVIFISTVLLGCANNINPFDDQNSFHRYGVGNNFYTTDRHKRFVNETTYYSYICDAYGADLPKHDQVTKINGNKLRQCSFSDFQTNHWKVFVKKSWNDIDRRCDDYLEWLYAKEKNYEPLLTQVNDIEEATNAIFSATGVSNLGTAFRVVAAAFNLTEDTLKNYKSTLLFAVGSNSVHGIVKERQSNHRNYYKNRTIDNIADAEKAIRDYLTICQARTIEFYIKNDIDRGKPEPLRELKKDIVAAIPASGVHVAKKQPSRCAEYVKGKDLTVVEKKICIEDGVKIQKNLCVRLKDIELGQFGPKTKIAIKHYQHSQGFKVTGHFEHRERVNEVRSKSVSCFQDKNKYENAYEFWALRTDILAKEFKQQLNTFLKRKLGDADAEEFLVNDKISEFTLRTRNAIKKARMLLRNSGKLSSEEGKYKINNEKSNAYRTLTHELRREIIIETN